MMLRAIAALACSVVLFPVAAQELPSQREEALQGAAVEPADTPSETPGATDTEADPPEIGIELDVKPLVATVGDRLAATLTVSTPAGTSLEPGTIGPELGPFSVLSGSWNEPTEIETGTRSTWTGELTTFRTGEHRLPAITLSFVSEGETTRVKTNPLTISIRSVLAEEEQAAEEEPELSDLKPPAEIAAAYGPLWAALGILAALLLGAGVLWWLNRRYGHKLAAAPAPEDPFHRTPPHVWVYAELQTLLERHLPERGEVDLFYSELSGILKRYLGGRYRVELLERTTDEVPGALRQAATPEPAIEATGQVLEECDRVKFAKERPDAEACRATVERIYEIVDTTKPVEPVSRPGERGAA